VRSTPLATVVGAALLVAAMAAAPSASSAHAADGADGADTAPASVGRYVVAVDGEAAAGWLAVPTSRSPSALLVFGHGCCGTPDQSALVARFARATGAVAVAMDYRGRGRWDVLAGSHDLAAAAADLQRRFPSIRRTVLYGVSMGGEVTGMAAAARPDLFTHWVSLFGVADLESELASLGTYPSATTSWIMAEAGGTPATRHAEYVRRSPVQLAGAMRLRRAYLLHGVGDQFVPYDQSRRMFSALRAAGVPASLWTFVTGRGGVQGGWHAATWTPTVPTPVGPAAHDDRGGTAEADRLVADLLLGAAPDSSSPWREHVVDRTTGVTR
jgi:acetyl esterase/lipase